jgi:hypothetical protein
LKIKTLVGFRVLISPTNSIDVEGRLSNDIPFIPPSTTYYIHFSPSILECRSGQTSIEF